MNILFTVVLFQIHLCNTGTAGSLSHSSWALTNFAACAVTVSELTVVVMITAHAPGTMAAARLRESCAAARRGTLSTGEKTLKSGAPHKTTSSNCHLLATKMTATIIPPFFERREVSNEVKDCFCSETAC